MSIRRFVELILDKNAAKRVEQDTKQSLDKGTDPKNAEKNLGRVGGAMQKLRGIALKLGAALGLAFAARKIQQFGKESVRVALEAEAVWNRLEGQLAAVGVRYEDVREEIDRTARAMQDATTVGDEDFAAILTELVGISGDYSASLREVQTVADLAAAKQIDLRTSAQLVGRVMVGETGTLSRYGIIVQEGADAMEVLRARFKGMAANEARDFEGRLQQINNEWGDFQQAVGDAMIEAGGGTSVLEVMVAVLKTATEWVNRNRMEIAGWGRLIISTVKAAYESVRVVVRALFNLGQVIGSGFELAMLELQRALAPTVNDIIDLLDKIPGVNIPIRMNEMTPDEYWAEHKRLTDQIDRDTTDMADAVWDLGDAYREVGRAARDAYLGQAQSARAGEADVSVSTGGGGLDIADPTDPNLRFNFVGAIKQGPIRSILDPTRARAAREAMEAQMALMEQRAQLTADGMTAAFDGFFESMASGFEGVDDVWSAAAELAQGVGQSIIAGLAAGYSDYHMAQGAGKLAEGTWPPNPAAIAAATKHFAAAALFRALPALAGAAVGGSRGPAGFRSGPGAVGTSRPGVQGVMGPEVNIYLDPLSPADPRFQRVVQGAVQNAKERYGENVRVNIHSRTGG